MSNIYFISDLHLGHKSILQFAKQYRSWATTLDEHDHTLIERIRSTCNSKRDRLFILGDVCFDITKMELLNSIPCEKILVRGNHDRFDMGTYAKYFTGIGGIMSYKGYWLTHCPIHPQELRGKMNICGHVHHNSVRNMLTGELDNRYINVCVENCNGYPINLEDIRDGYFKGEIK